MAQALRQIEKTGLRLEPIIISGEVFPSFTFQNEKKDFKAIVNLKDKGFIGFEKSWRF